MGEEKKFENQNEWDKKKIGMATFVALLAVGVLIGGKLYLTKGQLIGGATSVKGASTSQNTGAEVKPTTHTSFSSPNLSSALQQKISTIKDELSNINFGSVASASPQIQKVMNDIKDLQGLPSGEVKDFCQKVCGK